MEIGDIIIYKGKKYPIKNIKTVGKSTLLYAIDRGGRDLSWISSTDPGIGK